MAEQIINIERMEQVVGLFGNLDENVRMIESELSVSISFRSGEIRISGEAENVMRAARTVNGLLSLLNKGETLTEQSVRYVMSLASDGDEAGIEKLSDTDCICITSKGKPIKPKTIGQKKYVEAIRENTVTIGVGPAGTGKTYLAVAMAVEAFRAKNVNRIILKDRRSRQAKSWDFCPATFSRRSTRTCGRFTTHFLTCLERKISSAARSAAISR